MTSTLTKIEHAFRGIYITPRVVISVVISIILLRLVDTLLSPYAGLVYPPDTTVRYSTTEFQFSAKINALGFRGEPREAHSPPDVARVLAIGDSFTYGWGVDFDAAWPAVLEHILNKHNIPARVENLGLAGAGPMQYREIARRALKRLRPDFAIVAVLQGDDIRQAQQRDLVWKPSVVLRRAFPNMSNLLRRALLNTSLGIALRSEDNTIQQVWSWEAKRLIGRMTEIEVRRFQALEPRIRVLFSQGLLNPQLIFLAVTQPGYFKESVDTSDTPARSGTKALANQLGQIRASAARVNCEVLVVSVPYGIYVRKLYLENHRRLGFDTEDEMLTTTAPDEDIIGAARNAGLRTVVALQAFRRSSELLYYELDQHFTPAGHKLFAETLFPYVEPMIGGATKNATKN